MIGKIPCKKLGKTSLVVWCHKQDIEIFYDELTRPAKLWREKRVWKWLSIKTYFCLESVQQLTLNFWIYEILFSITIIFEFQTNHCIEKEMRVFLAKRDEQKCQTFDKLQKNARYQKQKTTAWTLEIGTISSELQFTRQTRQVPSYA